MLAAAVLAAACGGDDGPSRAEYRARANAICATAEARTAPLVRQLSTAARSLSAARAPEAAAIARRLQTDAGRYVAQLRRLEQPSDDNDEIEAFLGPAERLVDGLGRAAVALERRDVLRAAGVVQESLRAAGTRRPPLADTGSRSAGRSRRSCRHEPVARGRDA